MKICFLSSAHSATDKRVFDKEARSLRAHGFEVVHLCPVTAGEPLGQRVVDGVVLETYPRRSGIIGRVKQIFDVYQRARALDADAFHCNEVDSWFIGCVLRVATGRPCVFDVHENYPQTFAQSRFPRYLQPLVSFSIRAVYRLLAPFTAKIVLANRSLETDFPFACAKLVAVQNFAAKSALQRGTDRVETSGGPAVIVHLGLLSRLRGWPAMLDGLSQTKDKTIILHVIGEFNDRTEPDFFERVKQLGLEERMRFDRWLPFDAALEKLQAATAGIVLFQPGITNHVIAMPHKLFDYMLARVPVIAPSFCIEIARIIGESDCGLLVDPTDPRSIAAAMDAVSENPLRATQMGENGRRAVFNRYNWESEAEKLVNLYTDLLKRRAPPSQLSVAD